jgi:hypothetical protein
MNISLSIPRMKKVSDKIYKGSKKTYFMFNKFFFGNRAVDEITWKNIVETDRLEMTIWRTRIYS